MPRVVEDMMLFLSALKSAFNAVLVKDLLQMMTIRFVDQVAGAMEMGISMGRIRTHYLLNPVPWGVSRRV